MNFNNLVQICSENETLAVQLPSGIWRQRAEEADAFEYFKDPKCTILHRLDGPAVEFDDGSKQYYVNGLEHRIGKPACIWCDGTREWYVNGKHYRLNGPAIEYNTGDKEWWINGKQYSKKEFEGVRDAVKRHRDPANRQIATDMETMF